MSLGQFESLVPASAAVMLAVAGLMLGDAVVTEPTMPQQTSARAAEPMILTLSDPRDGSAVRVVPQRLFTDVNGHLCREYLVQSNAAETYRTACRNDAGRWIEPGSSLASAQPDGLMTAWLAQLPLGGLRGAPPAPQAAQIEN